MNPLEPASRPRTSKLWLGISVVLFTVLAALLYPATMGLTYFDPYRWGFNPRPMIVCIGLLAQRLDRGQRDLVRSARWRRRDDSRRCRLRLRPLSRGRAQEKTSARTIATTAMPMTT